MTSYSSTVVWMALAAQAAAWPARLHQANSSLMRLPPSDRAIVERLLRPQLGPLAQGEDAEQMKKEIQSFRVERLAGTHAIAVQATGEDFCGAGGGNCTFWVLDVHQQRVVLRADGIQLFAVDQRSKNGFPDVITRTHESAFEGELIRWHFVGGSYHPSTCATEQNADADGNPLPETKTTSHPCTPEGN